VIASPAASAQEVANDCVWLDAVVTKPFANMPRLRDSCFYQTVNALSLDVSQRKGRLASLIDSGLLSSLDSSARQETSISGEISGFRGSL
jgi:hypothetical protein